MSISIEEIKALREKTGLSVMECKKALEQTSGDLEKALIVLRKKSSGVALNKSGRTLKAGVVDAYIHASQDVGAIVLLLCETDFVAKNSEFKELAHNIAMHATATNPEFISREQVTDVAVSKARQLFEQEVKDKPKNKQASIVEGKMNAYISERVLLEQQYIKNPELTIQNLIEHAVQKFGERIQLSECYRLSVRG